MSNWCPNGWFNEYKLGVLEPETAAMKAASLELGADRMLNALLELFETWIEEADEAIKKNHYHDKGQEGIAYLYRKLAEPRG